MIVLVVCCTSHMNLAKDCQMQSFSLNEGSKNSLQVSLKAGIVAPQRGGGRIFKKHAHLTVTHSLALVMYTCSGSAMPLL